MLGLRKKLEELENINKPIRVGLIGAGLMGKGLVSQLMRVRGMEPSVVVSNKIADCIKAFELAGVPKERIVTADSAKEIDKAIENGKFAVLEDYHTAVEAGLIDVIVDATGVPEAGAGIAFESIRNQKHIVMLNVEADVVVGPYLNSLAKKACVVYTGSAGDEPGAVMELYDFAKASGFEVLAIGKGKNNPLDRYITPPQVEGRAYNSGLKPSRLVSFIDGTNTMVEMAAMSNATGFLPDIRGGHGPHTYVEELPEVFSLKKDGGILNRYGIVDYAFGIAPGVFAIITTDSPLVHGEMNFLKMGAGPNYVLFRPYHLTSLETPISIAKAAIYKTGSIVPEKPVPVSEVIAIAKKDLKKGESFDGIGEHSVYGSLDSYQTARTEGFVPIGLINSNAKAKRDISRDEIITYDMIDLDETTEVFRLRKLMERSHQVLTK
ncbi:MAG: NAD(P)-dependent oxidoreductase [Gudongella sp.]|jgi:predicted homoserine dehydrogenase-like protein|nr:NAD(P)-dependent oxidoreductase [Gudongella sp.]